MFTTRILTPGDKVTFFEGSYDACMTLAHAVEAFPQDYVVVEVYVTHTTETKYQNKSDFWA